MLGKKRHGKPMSLAESCATADNRLYISIGGGCADQFSNSSGFKGSPAFREGISGWSKSGSGSFLDRVRACAATGKCGKGSAADWYIDMKKQSTK